MGPPPPARRRAAAPPPRAPSHEVQQRPGADLGHPAAVPSPVEHPSVGRLHEHALRFGQQRSEHRRHVGGVEVHDVAVDPQDQVAVRGVEALPHGLALAARRGQIRKHLVVLQYRRPRARGHAAVSSAVRSTTTTDPPAGTTPSVGGCGARSRRPSRPLRAGMTTGNAETWSWREQASGSVPGYVRCWSHSSEASPRQPSGLRARRLMRPGGRARRARGTACPLTEQGAPWRQPPIRRCGASIAAIVTADVDPQPVLHDAATRGPAADRVHGE